MKDKEIKKMYNDIESKHRQNQFMKRLDESTKRTIESIEEAHKREKELIEEICKLEIKQIENEKKEEVKYEGRIPLFEKGELEYFDCNMHSIIESLLETQLKEKYHILLLQRIIKKQEEEIKTLKNNWNELEDWLETTISIHKQKGSEMLAIICFDILNKIKKQKESDNNE